MNEETDGQKEVKELQNRILNLESELSKFKKGASDSKDSLDKIKVLEGELEALRHERDDLKQKIWDKKERRAKERRNIPIPAGNSGTEKPRAWDDDSAAGGPFA